MNIYLAGFFKRWLPEISTVSLKRGTAPQLTSLNSYKIRNCLNIQKIFDILDNATSYGVANLCRN